jgi:hypothetical protein
MVRYKSTQLITLSVALFHAAGRVELALAFVKNLAEKQVAGAFRRFSARKELLTESAPATAKLSSFFFLTESSANKFAVEKPCHITCR